MNYCSSKSKSKTKKLTCLSKNEIIDIFNVPSSLKRMTKKDILEKMGVNIKNERNLIGEKLSNIYHRAIAPKKKNGWLSDDHIKRVILQNIKESKIFKGVFYIDEFFSKPIPINKNSYTAFVFNTSYSGTKGEHWVSLFIDKNKDIYYFDSNGEVPPQDFMEKTLEKIKGGKIIINKIRIQNTDGLCGDLAISFLINKINNCDNCVLNEKNAKKFTRDKNMI